MKVVYFVKEDCDACKSAKHKVDFFLEKWGAAASVETDTINVSTVDGLTEAAMREVADVPTVILENGGEEIARWEKTPPLSKDLKEKLGI